MKSKKIKTIVVHNGTFHADDIFAVAVISLVFQDKYRIKIIRTRDEQIVSKGDFVADVGGIYDAEKNRFDHHQEGGAGKRGNGIPYSSFGLVWRKFGNNLADSESVALAVDKKLVQPIDAGDNGDSIFYPLYGEIFPYEIQNFMSAHNPTWQERKANHDAIFLKLVEVAKTSINREIIVAQASVGASSRVEKIYENSVEKRIIIFDRDYPIERLLDFKEPLFVIYPNEKNMMWHVRAVRDNVTMFKNRKDLPKNWAGKRDKDLQKITGVSDAVFCHNRRFLAVARSKEGALKLAQLAIEQ